MCHTNFFGRIQGVTAIIGPSNLYLTGRTHEVYFPFSDGLLSQFPSLDRQLRGAYLAIELFRQIVIKQALLLSLQNYSSTFATICKFWRSKTIFQIICLLQKKFRSREQNWEKRRGFIYIGFYCIEHAKKSPTRDLCICQKYYDYRVRAKFQPK